MNFVIMYAKAKGAAVKRVDVYQQVYKTKDGVVVSTRTQENMVSTNMVTSTPSSSRTHQRMSKLETSHEELREELAQSEARHQAQMAEIMMSMRHMFDQLSQVMRDIAPSQVANTCYFAKHYFLQCIVM